jgi:beta-glucanase (GH16 family)
MRYVLAITAWTILLSLNATSPTVAQTSQETPTTPDAFRALKWDVSHKGEPLKLDQYRRTFHDDFHALSVTPDGDKGPWFAPVHGPFGAGKFLPPASDGPFLIVNNALAIRAEKKNGKWRSGLMQTVDSQGRGFAQQFGYFEMRAQFPPGKGGWPAFWLLSQNGFTDKTATRTEIDVVEWYGGDPKGHHASVHLWPAKQPKTAALAKHLCRSNYSNLNAVLTDGQLAGRHTYGAAVTPEWVIVYFDQKELARYPTVPEFKTPLYMVVDLAIFPGEADVADSPKEMFVDYVRAYSKL